MTDSTHQRPSPTNEFESLYAVIKHVSLTYIGDTASNFKGLSDESIEELEGKYARKFPEAYYYFLKTLAARLPKIFDCQLYNNEGIENAQEVAAELLKQDSFSLPDNAFVFSQWQGYQFYYFVDDGSQNPETFLYIEGGGHQPPTIYTCGCFTDWLINLSIDNMRIFERLNDYTIDEGITLLSGFLKEKSGK